MRISSSPRTPDTEPRAKTIPPSSPPSAPSGNEDPAITFARDFRASMPASYRKAHGWRAIQEHAVIACRRGGASVYLEPWRTRRGTVVVIVSDDRPGVLAMMSAAIASCDLDVLSAEAYCRSRAPLAPEAFALFELRRNSDGEAEAVDSADLEHVLGTLESLLRGTADLDMLLMRTSPTVRPLRGITDVSFADDDTNAILLVDAADRPRLLATITSALSECKARIVHSEVMTVGGRARDRFHLTGSDGQPLSPNQKRNIVGAVLAAIEAATGNG